MTHFERIHRNPIFKQIIRLCHTNHEERLIRHMAEGWDQEHQTLLLKWVLNYLRTGSHENINKATDSYPLIATYQNLVIYLDFYRKEGHYEDPEHQVTPIQFYSPIWCWLTDFGHQGKMTPSLRKQVSKASLNHYAFCKPSEYWYKYMERLTH